MKVWKGLIWPFLSKVLKFMLGIFERTATELAKKIPVEVIEPITAKIIEVATNTTLSGSEKMKEVTDCAMALLSKEKMKEIGNSALDTFLQVLYQDLKDRGIIK